MPICIAAGWSFHRWTEMAEIDNWLAETINMWRVDPSSLPAPRRADPFCGPEVWGEGRFDPPEPA